MALKTSFTTLLLFSCSALASALPLDEPVALHPVMQKSDSQGPRSATGLFSVRGNAFVINLEVHSTGTHYSAHALMSDHVEVWLAQPPHSKLDHPGRFYTSTFNDARYWFAKPEEAVVVDLPDGSFERANITQPCGDALETFEFQRRRTHMGMVHFGVNPLDGSVIAFDEEYAAGFRIAPLTEQVTVEHLDTTDTGYRIRLRVPPEAFGLVPKEGLTQFRVMLDVVGGNGKRQHTVLSTSPQRKWGEPSTFGVVTLPEPLTPSLPAALDFAGRPVSELPPDRRALHRSLWPFLVFPGRHWEQARLGASPPNIHEHRCDAGVRALNEHHEFNLITKPIRYAVDMIGDQRIEQLGYELFLDGDALMSLVHRDIQVLEMPGGEPGILYLGHQNAHGEFVPGPCAQPSISYLNLAVVDDSGSIVRHPVFSNGDCPEHVLVAGQAREWGPQGQPDLSAHMWRTVRPKSPVLVQEQGGNIHYLDLGYEGGQISVKYSTRPVVP